MGVVLKPGSRLFSAVCSAEFIVVKPPKTELDLTIGGRPPLDSAEARDGVQSVVEGHGGGAGVGKRFVDEDNSIELLCTKPGEGVPAVAGRVLAPKEAKALPASD